MTAERARTGQAAHIPRPGRSPGRLDRSRDAAILDAALAGVAEQGYNRLSMEDIATRARVGKAAIYRRWSSKADLVADAIAHWRRDLAPRETPNTGSLRGDIVALIAQVLDLGNADLSTIQVVVGVGTATMQNPVLAAALDDFVLSTPRNMIRLMLDRAAARGEVTVDRDLALLPDAVMGIGVLRVMTGRSIDRVFVRRVLEDVVLPLAARPAP